MITQEKTANPPEAQFDTRNNCITCGSDRLNLLSSRPFSEEPVHGLLAGDAYDEDPTPSLRNASWTFVQCENCGQKFHRDVLNDEWQDIHYNRWITKASIERFYAENSSAAFKREFEIGRHAIERMLLLEKLTRNIRADEPVRVLDFGCGKGEFLAICANCGFESVGVEVSAAREKKDQIEYFSSLEQVAEAYDLASFHAITLFEVLEHLNRPLDILRDLSRFAKKGAILILETPDCETVTDIQTERDFDLIGPLGHINAFTASSQERIAIEAGFTRISPGIAQCSADMARVYKREARRVLQPFLKRTTRQYFVKD